MFKFFSFFHSQNQKRKSIHKSNSYYFHSNPPNHPPGDFVTWCCLHLCHPSTTKWYYSTHTAKQPSQPSTSSWNLWVNFWKYKFPIERTALCTQSFTSYTYYSSGVDARNLLQIFSCGAFFYSKYDADTDRDCLR